jgi:hypothetical protein
MKTISYAAVLLLAAAAAACSSSTVQTPDPGPGTAGTPTSMPAPTTDPPADSTPPAVAAPVTLKAPTIDKVMKMQGALHVQWTNVQADCDSVEGERQAQMPDGTIMEKYKVAFTVPGEADNKHDVSATDAMK